VANLGIEPRRRAYETRFGTSSLAISGRCVVECLPSTGLRHYD